MPLYKRCCICGRIADDPHDAEPYKRGGYACDECYVKRVIPSVKWKGNKFNKYINKDR